MGKAIESISCQLLLADETVSYDIIELLAIHHVCCFCLCTGWFKNNGPV